MTTSHTVSKRLESFSISLFQALAVTITKACGSSWHIEMIPAVNTPSELSETVLVNCVLDGGLRGELGLEIRRAEAHMLASAFLGQPTAESEIETESVVLRLINSWMREYSSTVEQELGVVTVQASISSEKRIEQAAVFQAAIFEGANRISISMCLSPALIASLKQHCQTGSMDAADVSSKKTANGNMLPDPMNLNLVMDVELNVTLRFGQRRLTLREVLELTTGSVVELDRQVEEPVELLLEGIVIARGEAVVVDGNYGLRVTEVLQPVSTAQL